MSVPTPTARSGRGPAMGWSVLSVAALVLALAAALGPWPPAGGPPGRLAVRLPGPLPAMLLLVSAVAGLLLLALILPRPRRRTRKKDDEPFELYHEPPPISPAALVLLGLVALAPIALVVGLLWSHWQPFGEPAAPPAAVAGHPGPPAAAPAPAAPARPGVAVPAFTGVVGALALLGTLAALALVVWIAFGDRLTWWWAGAVGGRPAAEPLREATEEALHDLRHEPDARRAIILCYRRFEGALARAGFPRRPWETPGEFMRQTLAGLSLPSSAVLALTRLFERSRFSDHALGPPQRDEAVDALLRIRAALERPDSDAACA